MCTDFAANLCARVHARVRVRLGRTQLINLLTFL